MLIYILSSAVSIYGPDSESDMHVKTSQDVIKRLPKLLLKYSKEFTAGCGMARLIEVLSMIEKIDLSVYIDMRMTKVCLSTFNCNIRPLKHSSYLS